MSESTNTPTVVLVHGGFADASFWAPVIEDLQAHNVPVLAPPNPLRGLAHDAEYIASYVNQIDGPVLLVGHSYGGAVISVAGASTPNAVGLVYVAAFALDEGESFGEIFGRVRRDAAGRRGASEQLSARGRRDGGRADDRSGALPGGVRRRPVRGRHPGPGCQPAAVRRDLRGSRRGGRLEDAALVGGRGDLRQRDSAGRRAPHGERAGAQTIEVDASHSIALSQPTAVAELIRTAVEATSAVPTPPSRSSLSG